MKSKIVLLLCLTLPLPIFWWAVKDIETKYDWFLFVDFVQHPRWYVHYTAYHVENIIKMFLLYSVADHYLDRKTFKVARLFLFLAVFRLLEYWLFRFNIPTLPVIGVALVYVLYIYSKNDS